MYIGAKEGFKQGLISFYTLIILWIIIPLFALTPALFRLESHPLTSVMTQPPLLVIHAFMLYAMATKCLQIYHMDYGDKRYVKTLARRQHYAAFIMLILAVCLHRF
jgi:hypothetical protein